MTNFVKNGIVILYLTLTNVVFESSNGVDCCGFSVNLTLTNVVFECKHHRRT